MVLPGVRRWLEGPKRPHQVAAVGAGGELNWGYQPGASVLTHTGLSTKLLKLHPHGGRVSRSVPSSKGGNFGTGSLLPHSVGRNTSWGDSRFKSREILLHFIFFFNLFFLEKFQNMSIGGQGQGKAWAAFRLTGLPHKGSRLNCGGPLPPPGPPPSLPCPPAPPPCDPSEGGTHCARPHHARKEDDRDAPAPGPTRGTGVPPLPSRPHPHHSCSPEAPPQWEPRGSLRTGNDITAGP